MPGLSTPSEWFADVGKFDLAGLWRRQQEEERERRQEERERRGEERDVHRYELEKLAKELDRKKTEFDLKAAEAKADRERLDWEAERDRIAGYRKALGGLATETKGRDVELPGVSAGGVTIPRVSGVRVQQPLLPEERAVRTGQIYSEFFPEKGPSALSEIIRRGSIEREAEAERELRGELKRDELSIRRQGLEEKQEEQARTLEFYDALGEWISANPDKPLREGLRAVVGAGKGGKYASGLVLEVMRQQGLGERQAARPPPASQVQKARIGELQELLKEVAKDLRSKMKLKKPAKETLEQIDQLKAERKTLLGQLDALERQAGGSAAAPLPGDTESAGLEALGADEPGFDQKEHDRRRAKAIIKVYPHRGPEVMAWFRQTHGEDL